MARYFDIELHTADNDFDHLGPASVQVVNYARRAQVATGARPTALRATGWAGRARGN